MLFFVFCPLSFVFCFLYFIVFCLCFCLCLLFLSLSFVFVFVFCLYLLSFVFCFVFFLGSNMDKQEVHEKAALLQRLQETHSVSLKRVNVPNFPPFTLKQKEEWSLHWPVNFKKTNPSTP